MKQIGKPDGSFKRFVPFTKVEDEPEGVRVYARATREELDRQGEVVSYDASKVAFGEFAEWFEKVTTAAGQDPSKGTVRVMHQPIVAGKMLDYSPNDADRAIDVSLLITDKEQGRKCKGGEYTGISIGGDDVHTEPRPWEGKNVPWVTKYRLGELSLVDTPACDSAVFTLVKRADGTGEEPEVKAEAPAVEKQREPEAKPSRFEKILKALGPAMKKGSEGSSIYPAIEALRSLQMAMESEGWEIAMGEEGMQAEAKADIAILAEAVTATIAFLSAEFAEQIASYAKDSGAQAASVALAASTVALRKVSEEPDTKENMTAIHQMGHALVKATTIMGAECPDGVCKAGEEEKPPEEKPKDEGKEEKPEEKPAGGEEEKPADEKEEEEEEENPFPKKGIATGSLQKVLDAVATVGDQVKAQGAEIASVKETMGKLPSQIESIEGRLQKIEKAPAPIGRPVSQPADKALGGVIPESPVDKAALYSRMAQEETDPGLRQAWALKAAQLVSPSR